MPNMSLTKNPIPEQDPNVRNKNFEEVSLGYDAETAVDEANRCLHCKNQPCVEGCPVNVKIPDFIDLIKQGKFLEANNKIKETSSLPAVCGRVCPQESQCESKCVRGIKGEPVAIGRLERFAADYAMAHPSTDPIEVPASNGHKVAIVGAGPAGLTCAGDLRNMGYDVTVFEVLHTAGGVLMYGIPEFRLPKAIVQKEIDTLKAKGVEFVLNFVVGRTETIDDLFADGYEAIFVGSGAGLPNFLHIPGEGLNGVYSANEYLTRVNLMKAYKEDSRRRSITQRRSQSSAAATLLWTAHALQSAWVLTMSTSYTAVPRLSFRHVQKKCTTQRKRALSSSSSLPRWKSSATRTSMSRASAARRWSWVSRMHPVVAVRFRSRAKSSFWMSMRLSLQSAPLRIR